MTTIVYLCSMIIQFFLPCFYGQSVATAYENLSASLFHSAWIPRNKKFRNSMLIAMQNMSQPVEIDVFGVFFVNLETYTKVIKFAFSLYAVLKSF